MPVLGLLPLWVVGAWVWFHAIAYPYWYRFGADSVAYYVTRHHWDDLYWLAPLVDGAYLYSPAFAQVIWPLTWLPWDAFRLVWGVAEVAVLAWLLRPMGWRWGAPLLLVGAGLELPLENVYPFLALAAVAGLRHPAAWAFPLLTKVTPGVGVLWFAVRREWRHVLTAVATTGAIVCVSFLISPAQWTQWFAFLRRTGSGGYFALIRYATATGLTIWGARTTRRWTVPAAMTIATPVWSTASLIILTAIPRLVAPPNARRVSGRVVRTAMVSR
ncbi:MAG: DUF2029 domain-containing protein [Jatrophihabitans sp.]|nr:MAG: DUF2029 domain-containing protein [Jatrophihabitans sp.]